MNISTHGYAWSLKAYIGHSRVRGLFWEACTFLGNVRFLSEMLHRNQPEACRKPPRARISAPTKDVPSMYAMHGPWLAGQVGALPHSLAWGSWELWLRQVAARRRQLARHAPSLCSEGRRWAACCGCHIPCLFATPDPCLVAFHYCRPCLPIEWTSLGRLLSLMCFPMDLPG